MHESVLLREVVEFLKPNRRGGTLVDATVGLGGHSAALLERYPAARLLAIDRDPRALELARERLRRFADRVTFVHCRNGVSRSGLVVTAYLMHEHRWGRDEALAFLRTKRPIARPNVAFRLRADAACAASLGSLRCSGVSVGLSISTARR